MWSQPTLTSFRYK